MSEFKKIYRWGIIGCGKISSDMCNVLLNNNRCQIIGCASQSLKSAQIFAKKFDIPIENAYDSYAKLVMNKSIDIIYIGTLHPNHYESSILGLKNGKHILCEKPATMNYAQLKDILYYAKKYSLFYMEGMWTKCFPAIKQVRQWINNGYIGDIICVDCNRGIKMPMNVPRLWNNKLGGGCLMDIGVYTVSILTMIFGPKLPETIQCMGNVDGNVDTMFSCMIKYNDKQYAVMNGTFYGNNTNECNIIGTRGRIRIFGKFHCPTKITMISESHEEVTKEYTLPNDYKYKMNYGSHGFCYEINEVIQCLDRGQIESLLHTWKDTEICMKIMDEMRRQIGIKYDADNILNSKL